MSIVWYWTLTQLLTSIREHFQTEERVCYITAEPFTANSNMEIDNQKPWLSMMRYTLFMADHPRILKSRKGFEMKVEYY